MTTLNTSICSRTCRCAVLFQHIPEIDTLGITDIDALILRLLSTRKERIDATVRIVGGSEQREAGERR